MTSSKSDTPHILLVNPWIHDFAAYDFWARPYGLLALGAVLRQKGFKVTFIDCLDRFHPLAPACDPHSRNGRGPYTKEAIAKPAGLEEIQRTFCRYGIKPEWLQQEFKTLSSPPDLILVTSIMTYWYPGVFETIRMLRDLLPQIPIVLGGIYARLYPQHAKRASGADEIVTDNGQGLFQIIEDKTGYCAGITHNPNDLDNLPYPAFDLQYRLAYIPLLTTRGCAFDCAYCAASFLQPEMYWQSVPRVLEEVDFWHRRYGVINFAFYDDALLVNAKQHAIPLLEGLVRKKYPVAFHTPNALHIRAITQITAELMFAAGFQSLRLGLETTAFDNRSSLDRKVTESDFFKAVKHLKHAGFRSKQIGAYLLTGLPGQRAEDVKRSIDVVKAAGITPVMAYYTPMPQTRLWPEALASSRYDLAADPVFCNNAIFPCGSEDFSWKMLSDLKEYIRT
ncbi:MAG: radical SAM protein [Desulfobacteraceae bacterium]|nr:radical SAM protein [Desulfobacteraceae bacterium]